MNTDALLVAEVTGPVLARDGRSRGQRSAVVRLGGCNLTCGYCDVPHTWDARRFDLRQHLVRRSAALILADVLGMDVDLVTITGGEPLLQQRRASWPMLLRCLTAAGCRVEIETNGTVVPSGDTATLADAFDVSPKVSNANTHALRINPAALIALRATGKASFRFVVGTIADLTEIAGLVEDRDLAPVWITPMDGADPAFRATLADLVLARGWSLADRL